VKAKVKFTPMQAREVASRVTIAYPESPEQVLKIVSDPNGGVIATLQKETLDALAHFKRFSGMGKLHVWVETLHEKESRNKALKHKHEYRNVIPGKEAEQVVDLLSKLPDLTLRLTSAIAKAKRMRYGFAFWVNLGDKIGIELERGGITESLEMGETAGDILKGMTAESVVD